MKQNLADRKVVKPSNAKTLELKDDHWQLMSDLLPVLQLLGCEGGGAIAGRTRRRSRPMMGPHRRLRTIDTAGGGAPKTAGGGYRGSAIGEAQWPSAPGRWAGESPPPVGRHWTISQRRGRIGRVKRRAAAGSPAP